jgi:hypothetical protein
MEVMGTVPTTRGCDGAYDLRRLWERGSPQRQ